MYTLIDNTYLGTSYLRRDVRSALLSPGKASDTIVQEALPKKLALRSSEWDQVFVEDEGFRSRLQDLRIGIDESMVREEALTCDRKPSVFMGNRKRDHLYSDVVKHMEY